MKLDEINNIKNKKYIVILPKCDYDIKESVEFSFDNVFFVNYEPNDKDIKLLIDFTNNHLDQLILFDFDDYYRKILPYIKKNKIKFVYKGNLAQITNPYVRSVFNNIMEFYDRNIIKEIACLDKSTYLVLKNAKIKATHILLDLKRKKTKLKKSNSIGILGNDYDPDCNTYNQLSAVSMVDYNYIKIIKHMPATEHFIRFFNIKEKEVKTIDELIVNNYVNLYCNFTGNNFELILKSMDNNVPCILGNTDIFDKFPTLKKYLVLKSDDDINEIASKISIIKEKGANILKEYDKFRKKYKEESKQLIEKFLK